MGILLQVTTEADFTLPALWQRIVIALLIGLLIGVERERKRKTSEGSFAGIRTFPLISILGFLAALISSFTTIEAYLIIFMSFGILVAISYYFSAKKGGIGGTNEITLLLVFVLGSLVYWGHILLSAALAVILLMFLTLKAEFHTFAGAIEQEDIFATLKFAIITIIILPLLPNEAFDPFNVLNPRKIWYMVVLIAGISFVGYVLFKLIGAKRGIQVLSILGGLASSTALTLSFTHQSKDIKKYSRNFAAGIVLASTILFPRILIIVFIVNRSLAEALLFPVLLFTTVGIFMSLLIWRKSKSSEMEEVQLTNPFKLMIALKFGLLFAVILFVSSAAQHYLGNKGVYYTSMFAGFADLDAIALTIVDLLKKNLTINVATISIVIAFTANTIVKAGIAYFWGSKELKKYTTIGFSVIVAVLLIYLVVSFL
ncbi:MAG: hypothetical protein A2V66_04650 [Ignavibacteria bacterium RBG_13_36_8]|nr:MAG: hypothetical protein A2V66_04650 [Ignavibacteria bacterium RBG_13_36_8]